MSKRKVIVFKSVVIFGFICFFSPIDKVFAGCWGTGGDVFVTSCSESCSSYTTPDNVDFCGGHTPSQGHATGTWCSAPGYYYTCLDQNGDGDTNDEGECGVKYGYLAHTYCCNSTCDGGDGGGGDGGGSCDMYCTSSISESEKGCGSGGLSCPSGQVCAQSIGCGGGCSAVNGTWVYGTWGACTKACGVGTQSRPATCVGASCGGGCGTMGEVSRLCNTQACPTCSVTSGVSSIAAGDPNYYPFTATATSPGSITSYSWTSNLGGLFSATNTKNTSWRAPTALTGGNATLTLTVRDSYNATGSCSKAVRVVPGYILTSKAWQKDPNSASCNTNTPLITNSIPRFAVYSATNALLGQGNTNSSGSYTLQISRYIKDINICATYAPSGVCLSYEAKCSTSGSLSAGGCFSLHTNYPNEGTNPPDQYVGFQEIKKDPWVTAIDGNVQANIIGNGLPCNTLGTNLSGSFKSNLINLTSASANRTYIFSKNQSTNFPLTGTYIESQTTRGGWALNVLDSDEYLSKLTFKAPNIPSMTTTTSLKKSVTLDSSASAKILKISVTDFNALTASGTGTTYYFSGANPRTVVLYIEGNDSDEVVINGPITKDPAAGNQVLFLVTDLPVRITKNVGTAYNSVTKTYTGYTKASTPTIQAGIISSKQITLERDSSVDPKTSPDKAIMLQGPVASMDKLSFLRDSGFHNDEFPPQSVKRIPGSYLYNLTSFERANSMYKSATGLGIYDIQWVYPEN